MTEQKEQPEVSVLVRYRAGQVERVTASRAARLIVTDAAEPEGRWSEAELRAVLQAHDKRQAEAAAVLVRDGLLLGHYRRQEPEGGVWGWLGLESPWRN